MIEEIVYDTDMDFDIPPTVGGIIVGYIIDSTSFDIPESSVILGGFTYGFIS